MKKTLTIITVLLSLYSYSQTPVLSLEQMGSHKNNIAGAYYKDLNNVLNQYEGTWVYTNGNTSLKIVLVKKSMYFEGKSYEDLMIGEYQYIENGVEKINTLSRLNQNLNYNHGIYGNSIHKDCYYTPRGDCTEGEARLILSLFDITEHHSAEMILKRRVVNGQQAIKAFINFQYSGNYYVDIETPSPTMPWQDDYILFKQ
ncbi:hypothetical protein J2X31_000484 [Flavobacterium arsenatis]|uniref:DUF6705 domain-containing protein n=1 Tax=Flavobacterium arsenatis TaxID=1484332 RepID=A0ABU1TKX0_9FLAO|nr:DUF6705 family protein [Flavobacterium arsenatis]MDR6966491.1 hypothetical protein [Flavobacterium arsenatis]